LLSTTRLLPFFSLPWQTECPDRQGDAPSCLHRTAIHARFSTAIHKGFALERFERFVKMDRMLRGTESVSRQRFLEEIAVSKATFKRDLDYLRDRVGAPIVYDRQTNGYRYDKSDGSGYALPGLWFSGAELHALLTMEHLLEGMGSSFLTSHLEPLRSRIQNLLEAGTLAGEEIGCRVRLLPTGQRFVGSDRFREIIDPLLRRQRIRLVHFNRKTRETTRREVSPQRLTYYRDNWYLEAWCHLREGIRLFSLDAIQEVESLEVPALAVAPSTLAQEVDSGYGIFSGKQVRTAVLRFSEPAAQWVSASQWHPDATGGHDRAGRYVLRIPYANDTEILMDILRYGADIEVLRPAALRQKAVAALETAIQLYRVRSAPQK
jgi:predicted DNA-binding transcriptional regulator YafY